VSARRATLIRTGECVEDARGELEALYRAARQRLPDGFPSEETRELKALRDAVSLAFVERLRDWIAAKTGIPAAHLSLDKFSIHGCGPVSLHDDKHNYPGVYFVIVVAHSGRLGVVDHRERAVRHATGEILLLDPHRKHALLPEGRTWREHPYERTHSPVHDEEDQFLFVCFDVPRHLMHERFRTG
jgi:hypothetical protein